MEEKFINNMADEAKSVEELLGRYQHWSDSGRGVARDMARRYLIIRDERDALKDEIDLLKQTILDNKNYFMQLREQFTAYRYNAELMSNAQNEDRAQLKAALATLQARLAVACHIEASNRVDFDHAVLDQLGELDALKEELAALRGKLFAKHAHEKAQLITELAQAQTTIAFVTDGTAKLQARTDKANDELEQARADAIELREVLRSLYGAYDEARADGDRYFGTLDGEETIGRLLSDPPEQVK